MRCISYTIYRPSYNKQSLFDILYNSFNSYNFSNNNIILCGDFNINCMDSLYSQPFFNILHQLNVCHVIHKPIGILSILSASFNDFVASIRSDISKYIH